MAARDVLRLVAMAALGPAVVSGADGVGACAAETCAQDAEADETSLIQMKGAVAWRPHRNPVGEVQPSEEFDAAEGGEDETDEIESDDKDLCGIGGFVRYHNYEGPLNVKGKMWIRFIRKRQDLSYRLLGVDPSCSQGAGPEPNSCGIHFHAGTSCNEDALGHFWNEDVLASDPWKTVSYTSVAGPLGELYAGGKRVPVLTGLSRSDIRGRVVIVHDYTGARVACAPITGYWGGHPPSTNELPAVKVNWAKSSTVQGKVELVQKPGKSMSDTGVYLTTELTGVDEKCDMGPGSAAESCGLSVVKAGVCRAPYEAADLWNTAARKSNPWAHVSYASFSNDKGSYAGHVTHMPVNIGLDYQELTSYIFLVRDYAGKVMACGTISK